MRKLASLLAVILMGSVMTTSADSQNSKKATFAGGCFWCMTPPFERLKGVSKVVSGYTGGSTKNPTYEEVCSGKTGHAESIQVIYDPSQINYRKLLEVFWHNVDPTQADGQFVDVGNQYRSAIFYNDDAEKREAEESKRELEKSGRFKSAIVTQIVPASVFYPAEEYHQDYYKKDPLRYQMYRAGSGRDQFIKKTWGSSDH